MPYSISSYQNVFSLFIRVYKKMILSFFKKRKYDFLYDHKKKAVVTIKNTLVNTYLSLSINNQIVYAKSTGMIGFKKKQRRIKSASYKLGKDLSLVLKSLISKNKIGSFSIDLVGYSRYYRAIISNIRKCIRLGVKSKVVDPHSLVFKKKLKFWKLRKKLIQSVLKKKLKLPMLYIQYEKHLESQFRKYSGFFFKKHILDKTSVPHGTLRPVKNYYNNRYW